MGERTEKKTFLNFHFRAVYLKFSHSFSSSPRSWIFVDDLLIHFVNGYVLQIFECTPSRLYFSQLHTLFTYFHLMEFKWGKFSFRKLSSYIFWIWIAEYSLLSLSSNSTRLVNIFTKHAEFSLFKGQKLNLNITFSFLMLIKFEFLEFPIQISRCFHIYIVYSHSFGRKRRHLLLNVNKQSTGYREFSMLAKKQDMKWNFQRSKVDDSTRGRPACLHGAFAFLQARNQINTNFIFIEGRWIYTR